jgi:ABC-type multidrug transport system ATPase subunit/Ca2+-binding EF-hand superfamily protein
MGFDWRTECPKGYVPIASSNGADCDLENPGMDNYYLIRTVVLLCAIFVPALFQYLDQHRLVSKQLAVHKQLTAGVGSAAALFADQLNHLADSAAAAFGGEDESLMKDLRVDISSFKNTKRERMRFDYSNLKLVLHGSGKTVLQGVSGSIKSGSLVAVMGPSGAGKTTLMNVMCGRAHYGDVSGEMRLNGRPDAIIRHRKKLGFVPQDDTVHGDLTVYENLKFAAALKLPRATSFAKRERIVADTMQLLQIDHIKHSIVGGVETRGISGGQRKRVNIGLEIVADPVVLFLDEPTSGLDSTSAEVVLSALQDMTRTGMTVITVIHQPRYSIFERFDQVILMGGGKTVYSGPSRGALPYFKGLGFSITTNENPADFYMDVIGGQSHCFDLDDPRAEKWKMFDPNELVERWKECSPEHINVMMMKMAFDELDVDGSGAINVDDVYTLLENVFQRPPPPNEAQRFITLLDIDGDGTVTWDEFLQGFDHVRSLLTIASSGGGSSSARRGFLFMPSHVNRMKRLFDEVDSDRNGLDQKELALIMVKLRSPGSDTEVFTPEQTNAIIDFFDGKKEAVPRTHSPGSRSIQRSVSSRSANGVNLHWEEVETFLRSKKVGTNWEEELEKVMQRKPQGERKGLNAEPDLPDIEPRITPSFLFQTTTLVRRGCTKVFYRALRSLQVDLALIICAAILIGNLQGTKYSKKYFAQDMMLTVLFLTTLIVVGSLRVFGKAEDRPNFWRESSSGISTMAYFTAQNIVDLPLVVIKPCLYCWIYFAFTRLPVPSETALVGILIATSWAASGYGYVISIVLPPDNSTLFAVIFAIIIGAFLSGVKPNLKGNDISVLSFSYHALEAITLSIWNELPEQLSNWSYNFVGAEFGWGDCSETPCTAAEMFPPIPPRYIPMGQLPAQTYGESYMKPVIPLIVMGLVLRILAAILLTYCVNRPQQVKPTPFAMLKGLVCGSSSNNGTQDAKGLEDRMASAADGATQDVLADQQRREPLTQSQLRSWARTGGEVPDRSKAGAGAVNSAAVYSLYRSLQSIKTQVAEVAGGARLRGDEKQIKREEECIEMLKTCLDTLEGGERRSGGAVALNTLGDRKSSFAAAVATNASLQPQQVRTHQSNPTPVSLQRRKQHAHQQPPHQSPMSLSESAMMTPGRRATAQPLGEVGASGMQDFSNGFFGGCMQTEVPPPPPQITRWSDRRPQRQEVGCLSSPVPDL